MEHQVCKGDCGCVSDQKGTCDAEGCANKGKPFEPCNCEDGSHGKDSGTASESASPAGE